MIDVDTHPVAAIGDDEQLRQYGHNFVVALRNRCIGICRGIVLNIGARKVEKIRRFDLQNFPSRLPLW